MAIGVFDDGYYLLTSAETDARGQTVLLLPVDARVFQVVALKSGIGMDYFENDRSWPDRARAQDTLPKRVDLTLDGAQTVRVRATDSVNRDLPAIDLTSWSIQKNGGFTFGGILPTADCRLIAYDAESSQHLQKVSMKGTETLDLGDLEFDAKKK